MREVSIKIKNYKCFGDSLEGFNSILPINVIIGRNNSGKSSLLDLIKYAIRPYDLSSLGHNDQKPEVILTAPLSEKELKKVFHPHASGGSVPGHTHWEFGKRWINKKLTVKLELKDQMTFLRIDPPFTQNTMEEYQRNLAREKINPFSNKQFKHLRAERDIRPEGDHEGLVNENGSGATNIIQQFINKVALPSDLVEKTFLNELNKIMEPDASFTDIVVQQIEGDSWEVFLEEKGKGRIALSQSGSGLKTVLLVLVYIYLVPHLEKHDLSSYIFAFEEIENNLHPALQRRLFLYIREIAVKSGAVFFLTTHSNVVIDLFNSDQEAQLIHVAHDGNEAKTHQVKAFIERQGVLDDLDIRASDLLQSNGVIWVEGPSDRLYINKWIELWNDGELREGAHYQCVFYGGRLLAHLSASDPNEELDELIKILLVNRNAIIVIDSDKKNKPQPINDTKKRILKEIEEINGICWITKGREIENYIPSEALVSLYNQKTTKKLGQYDSFSEYLDTIKKGEGKKFLSNKVRFAERIRSNLTKENLSSVLDIDERIKEVSKRIKSWNRLN